MQDQRPEERLRLAPTKDEELLSRDSAQPVCVGQSTQWYLCVLFALLSFFFCMYAASPEIELELSLLQFEKQIFYQRFWLSSSFQTFGVTRVVDVSQRQRL